MPKPDSRDVKRRPAAVMLRARRKLAERAGHNMTAAEILECRLNAQRVVAARHDLEFQAFLADCVLRRRD